MRSVKQLLDSGKSQFQSRSFISNFRIEREWEAYRGRRAAAAVRAAGRGCPGVSEGRDIDGPVGGVKVDKRCHGGADTLEKSAFAKQGPQLYLNITLKIF